MPAAPAPTNFNVQKGDGAAVYLSWDTQASASSGFSIQRSIDGVNYVALATPAAGASDYTDSTVTVGTQYWYEIASNNGTLSAYVVAGPIVPTKRGFATLGEIRLLAQQRADRVGSNFVTKVEWNQYVNQSYHELYDLLTTTYEDYNVAPVFTFATDGRIGGLYPLPDGVSVIDAVTSQIAQPFFKLLGVDMGISGGSNAWVSLKKFDMIERNRYVFPQVTSTYMGVFNAKYRLIDGNIMLIPSPGGGQFIRLWYIPRMKRLIADYDQMEHVDGWHEYVIIDAAIRALLKEE